MLLVRGQGRGDEGEGVEKTGRWWKEAGRGRGRSSGVARGQVARLEQSRADHGTVAAQGTPADC